ncbi:MAG: hypothetical protein HY673_02450 [Chloroflexi bacterium]|nr:hypothetical protein [Chloroflexota bacterium]
MDKEAITIDELTIERTPRELLNWVESKIESADEETIRLRQGLAKQLVEEVYPLAIFAFKKYGETQSVHVKPVIGNQNFDAILTDNSCSPALVSYVEVTQAHEGEAEYLRDVHLQEHGYVPGTRTVKKEGTKETGLRVSPQAEAVSVDSVAESEMQKIVSAIGRKEGKDYPANTCLVVKFDDGYMFRRAMDHRTIDRFMHEELVGRDLRFNAIYLVGKFKKVFRQYTLVRDAGKITGVELARP